MFRNYRTFAFVFLAIVASAATSAISQAVQPPARSVSHHRYYVEYRVGKTAHVMGPYRSHKRAHAVAHSLRLKGYHAHVVER